MFRTIDDSKLLDYVVRSKGKLLTSTLEKRKSRQFELAAFRINDWQRNLIEHFIEPGSELVGKVAIWIQSANRFARDAMLVDDYERR